jgi:protein-S-isoprenylcysteine O-methyltransferase Ste14
MSGGRRSVVDFLARAFLNEQKIRSAERWVRLRVPLTWALGLVALALARPTPGLWIIGLVIGLLGEAIRIWAAGHLVKGAEVTRSGPYSWTRNPLYFGSAIMGAGFCVAAGRWDLFLLFGALLLGVYRPAIRTEANNLAERFPDTYREYARVVPLLVPRPWRKGASSDERQFSWKRVLANKEHKAMVGWLGVAILLWAKMNWL